MATPTKRRPQRMAEPAVAAPPVPSPEPRKDKTTAAEKPAVPFLLDFYPLEDTKSTQLAEFYRALGEHRLITTRCRKDGLFWPPRLVCPVCHERDLEWVDLPRRGRIYAFSAVLAGAPMGMEADLPYVVGLIDLDASPLRLFGRIVGTPWNECRIGQSVDLETFDVGDGRHFYRFRTAGR